MLIHIIHHMNYHINREVHTYYMWSTYYISQLTAKFMYSYNTLLPSCTVEWPSTEKNSHKQVEQTRAQTNECHMQCVCVLDGGCGQFRS